LNQAKLEEIYQSIKEYKKVIIFPHARPDGDCIGTSFGLKDIISTTWPKKEVHVAGETSVFTKFIDVPEQLEDDQFEGALAILVDTANSERIADQRFTKCAKMIKIDHHIPVQDFGDIDYVDTSRAAAALIVLDLFMMNQDQLKMSPRGAKALFFGILTDTGRFKYEGVDGVTFRNVAVLYDNGLVAKEVYDYLETRTEELTRFKGFMLQNYKKTDNGVVYFKILPEYLDEFGVTLEEASSLVNELGHFEDYPIWLLFAEYEEKIVRARMRSKGPALNELAGRFDGGGHKLACGANLGTWERADELVIESDKLAKEYKESMN
jgi:phosphoesterase RecJ-like protein